MYIYIYIYIERERDTYTHTTYTYVYIYIYTHIHIVCRCIRINNHNNNNDNNINNNNNNNKHALRGSEPKGPPELWRGSSAGSLGREERRRRPGDFGTCTPEASGCAAEVPRPRSPGAEEGRASDETARPCGSGVLPERAESRRRPHRMGEGPREEEPPLRRQRQYRSQRRRETSLTSYGEEA